MEKIPSIEKDLEEWELLDDGILRGKMPPKDMSLNSKGDVQMDYFMCPSHPSKLLLESIEGDLTKIKNNNQIAVPDPIEHDPIGAIDNSGEEFVKEINVKPTSLVPESRISYENLDEKQFADMKLDDKNDVSDDEKGEEEEYVCSEDKRKVCLDGFEIRIWRWRLSGIGAICSIGVAAATICMFILGGQNKQKQHQNQKLQFQIYSDDKNLKHVVQHATRWNHAMSAMRGVPVPRANISFGGYYDGL